ncbi:hypothetical protein HMPREF1544_03492 [Mucor circinelloides 1006PhL]|uniref:C2H2-type domain-containing protein n=1 Tax=Mucor circinelloides f. circinelloides (strain 1006PhL) TaxID=1220926 RepID=S2JME8_MUCC1|nr:hypothetical protein HMPREF1544_03492 [Mucor circinelloides 1006PhL]
MKLRDRQKRVSNDIKQEDKKAVIDFIDTPSSVPNESNAYSSNIKQEDTKNDNNLLQQNDAFKEENNYSYRCDICKKGMLNLKSVLQHRKTHNGRRPLSTIFPDPDDPNHYCRACDFTYARTSSYKQHCRYIHGMTSVKLGFARSKPDGITDSYCKICDVRLSTPKKTNLEPDVDDPNNNCCACEKKFKSRCKYRKHLRLKHLMVLPRLRNNASLESQPNPKDPQYFCSICKKSYKTLALYRIHCNNAHFLQLD